MRTARADDLLLEQGPFDDPRRSAAHKRLLSDVLGPADTPSDEADGPWRPLGLFDRDGRCVGGLDVGRLTLTADGAAGACSGIRSVAVDPAWRGRGLFRDLMKTALAKALQPVFLYTETPALYEQFGFKPLAQHLFVGSPPSPCGQRRSRPLQPARNADRATIARLWEARAPISSYCTLSVDRCAWLANLDKDANLKVAYIADPETVIVYETRDEDLILVDILASEMPSLARLLGALGIEPRQVEVLFPPDRLGWMGEPRSEDTGLMSRGALPSALARPFMFPPTVEF